MVVMKQRGDWVQVLVLAGIAALACSAQPASAREGWDCNYAGTGADAARYVTHFEKRGADLVEPHWPAPISYRILVNTHETLVAVHAYAEPSSFRRDTQAGAIVLMIDKRTGRLRRSSVTDGDDTDQVLAGRCEAY
jgi:hypothetical protein